MYIQPDKIFTHIFVHLARYNYSYNCTNLLKTVLQLYVSMSYKCMYT